MSTPSGERDIHNQFLSQLTSAFSLVIMSTLISLHSTLIIDIARQEWIYIYMRLGNSYSKQGQIILNKVSSETSNRHTPWSVEFVTLHIYIRNIDKSYIGIIGKIGQLTQLHSHLIVTTYTIEVDNCFQLFANLANYLPHLRF